MAADASVVGAIFCRLTYEAVKDSALPLAAAGSVSPWGMRGARRESIPGHVSPAFSRV
jgi:hypothetical protein